MGIVLHKIEPKPNKEIINSRHIKILSTKKSDIKDTIAIVWLDEDKYGELDLQKAKAIVNEIDKVDKTVSILVTPKKYKISLYDASNIRTKDLVITVTCSGLESLSFMKKMDQDLKDVFKKARSVKVVFVSANNVSIQ